MFAFLTLLRGLAALSALVTLGACTATAPAVRTTAAAAAAPGTGTAAATPSWTNSRWVEALRGDDLLALLMVDDGTAPGFPLRRYAGSADALLAAAAADRMDALPVALRDGLSPASRLTVLVPRHVEAAAGSDRVFFLLFRPGGFQGTPAAYGPLTLRELHRWTVSPDS
ncbi:hypothetical protein [uncultured Xylophilus sp.]|uniref:hypothetical protein n=1 Tax=uncultured Xylophilus sp. TaxID=296832 RepID=UPI0025E6C092|nr:hypothetical protein [uncultured Xylophilus sp.]